MRTFVAIIVCSLILGLYGHHASVKHRVAIDQEALSDLFHAVCFDKSQPEVCMTELDQVFWTAIAKGEYH